MKTGLLARRLSLFGIGLLVLALAAPLAWAQDSKPNILVIWGDDIGIFNISAYSHGLMGYETPNIEKVAAQGAIFTEDQLRPDWRQAVARLRELGRVVLLTGAENAAGFEDYFDSVFSGIPPEGKASVIRQLKTEGTVVMIGDGSNDAPSLAEADLGIAFGAPTTLAVDAAEVIVPGDRLERIFLALEILRSVRRRIRQNLAWALLYNAIAIPIAVSGYLNPLFAALAMSSSSLLVVWNSTRQLGPVEPIDPQSRQLAANQA